MKLFLVTVLISMVAGTWAIECYVCGVSGCTDPFDSSASGVSNTCPGSSLITYEYCVKAVSGSSVIRSCATACTEACVGDACTYCCKSNLCNGGTTVTTSFVAMGVAMLAAVILSRQ
ncbi:bucandin-like [Strongylocentrotus purpuratus]|uniref:Uncharacterized protein n=1 Tax=Strongylocentrotus purpuratus TaxID=7668 RepID=A0A7M7HM99_STRPU|nr:bucandin-like [Strongylocentrotus purpuratus]|eukprot:XP_011666688.1 PREDICTED: bucandin-like [Strongylocentrotus purpuratus]